MIRMKDAWAKLAEQYEKKLAGKSGSDGWCYSTYICCNINSMPDLTEAQQEEMIAKLFQTFRPRTPKKHYGLQVIWPTFRSHFNAFTGDYVPTPAVEINAENYGARASACAIMAEGVTL